MADGHLVRTSCASNMRLVDPNEVYFAGTNLISNVKPMDGALANLFNSGENSLDYPLVLPVPMVLANMGIGLY